MERHLAIAEAIAELLDSKFSFLGLRFGLDPILGLIPWVGDFISLFLSFYLVWIAMGMKLPEEQIGKMVRNIMMDFVIGLVPVVGDVTDFFFKANRMNLKILREHKQTVISGHILAS